MQVQGHDNPPRYYPTWQPADWTKQQAKALGSHRTRAPLAGSKYFLTALALLPIIAIVTSLFFWPVVDPSMTWMLMLFGASLAIYFTIQASFQPYKQGRITRRVFINTVVLNLLQLLLTTGAAILASGWAVRAVGEEILKLTNLAWLAIIIGMLAAFAAGFGAGWLVRWAWTMIFKARDETVPSD